MRFVALLINIKRRRKRKMIKRWFVVFGPEGRWDCIRAKSKKKAIKSFCEEYYVEEEQVTNVMTEKNFKKIYNK